MNGRNRNIHKKRKPSSQRPISTTPQPKQRSQENVTPKPYHPKNLHPNPKILQSKRIFLGKVDFFIVGSQKGGTTSATKNLNKHPRLFLPDAEPHFFDSNYRFGYDWYHNKFPSRDGLVLGESTPSLGFQEESLQRISEYNPNAKIIYLLREPIMRAYSQWNMFKKTQKINEEFIKFFQNDKIGNAFKRGQYIRHIEFFHKYFRPENILILISEQIKNNPQESYKKIFEFIGVETHHDLQFNQHRVGVYNKKISKDDFVFCLNKFDNFNNELYNYLGYKIPEWEKIYEQFR